jgi:hypothetical protein
VATVVFAAAAQLLTAGMTRYVLKRELLQGQRLAVSHRTEPQRGFKVLGSRFYVLAPKPPHARQWLAVHCHNTSEKQYD